MGVTYIPYNPQLDPWAMIGQTAGGLMRDNYDQRGANKVLGYMEDQRNYLANQEAQTALNDWQQQRKAWDLAANDEERNKYAQAAQAAREKLAGYGFGGLSGDTTNEQMGQIGKYLSTNMATLSNKYNDPRYANMPKFGQGKVGQPGRMFSFASVPMVPQEQPIGGMGLEAMSMNPYSNKQIYGVGMGGY